jgi:hypothetical protein
MDVLLKKCLDFLLIARELGGAYLDNVLVRVIPDLLSRRTGIRHRGLAPWTISN